MLVSRNWRRDALAAAIVVLLAALSTLSRDSLLFSQISPQEVSVNVSITLDSLLYDEDTDGDKRITIDDPHIAGTERGNKRFRIVSADRERYEVAGTYYLSNLLQELKLAEEAGQETPHLSVTRIFEPPSDRISRMIRHYFWDGLTRRVDEAGLVTVMADEKTVTVDGFNYLYVPPRDKVAVEYFTRVARKYPQWKIRIVSLPEKITSQYVRSLDGRHGLLSLALERRKDGTYVGAPFVVPGGRFNEMYGWDSYFIVLGLLEDGRIELAKSMVDNFVYQITYYGAILNANRTYYLTRSQPPFLTSMVRGVYDRLPKTSDSKLWLRRALDAAMKEYHGVWMNPLRLAEIGLSRYCDFGFGAPPEVEAGHFDAVFTMYARKFNMDTESFEKAYRSGEISVPELDEYFIHDRCMRESGHDTSYRLENMCANLVTVDLNSLLYKFERDIAEIIEAEFGGKLTGEDGKVEESSKWHERAERRKELMNRYLWNAERGMFFDYDVVKGQQTGYESATMFYPLWAGLATEKQAGELVKNGLPMFEVAGGIVSTTQRSRGPLSLERPPRQWDYPHGWSPHQMLVWQGLLNYGFDSIAHRLIYRWLFTITLNAANYNGTVPEKFDVVGRTHQVFAEYGNVGTKFAYITREGFGWTNASYQVGLRILPSELRQHLNQLIPPEWIFSR